MGQKPILLLADSQNLFWQVNEQGVLKWLWGQEPPHSAAYIGAANNDRPEFYQIFQAAMQWAGVRQTMHIRKEFTPAQRQALQSAQIILLAGGDVAEGWKIIRQTGMADILVDRYYQGAWLIGVSAGAVHLGLLAADEEGNPQEMLKLVPFVVAVHEEEQHWAGVKQLLHKLENRFVHGLGIPLGSGIIYRSDHTIEAVRKPAWLFEQDEAGLKQQLLLPKQTTAKNMGAENS